MTTLEQIIGTNLNANGGGKLQGDPYATYNLGYVDSNGNNAYDSGETVIYDINNNGVVDIQPGVNDPFYSTTATSAGDRNLSVSPTALVSTFLVGQPIKKDMRLKYIDGSTIAYYNTTNGSWDNGGSSLGETVVLDVNGNNLVDSGDLVVSGGPPRAPSSTELGKPLLTDTFAGIWNKRDLNPACTIRNTSGDVIAAFVEIHGVYPVSWHYEIADCNTSYNGVNGGGAFPNGEKLCDHTGNWQTFGFKGDCFSGDHSGCSHRMHFEMDRDWFAKGFCGAGTFCNNNTLAQYIASGSSGGSVSLDIQGFVFWDPTEIPGEGHSFSGWEIHPFTAWKLSSSPPPGPQPLSANFAYSPANPVPGSPMLFTGTATGGTSPYSFTWNFGDGGTGTGSSVSHTYTQGSYNVSLTTTDSAGGTVTTSRTVAVNALQSWNLKVSCAPIIVRISDITANLTGTSSYNTSPFTPGITSPVGTAKRWLTPGNTPSGWVSPGPPCTVTNSHGTVSVFVEIDGLKRGGITTEDCTTSYDRVNGGASNGGTCGSGSGTNCGSYCDSTLNSYDPATVPNYSTSCTSASDPTCYGRIHTEIDHDWKAAHYCGTGTTCDNSTLATQTAATSTLIDIQGFVYWDPSNLNQQWHSFNGWEIHPLTGWRLSGGGTHTTSTAASCSPSSLAVSVSATCTATVTDTSGTPITPAGTVSFSVTGVTGSFSPFSCTLASGSCSVSFTPSSAGNATITGVYGGDSSHSGSSGKTTVTVSKRATSTSVACAPSTVVVGQSTSCTASVTDTSPGTASTPTGMVTFTPGGTCTLASGSCSISITPTVVGTLSVSANYGGDSTHGPSTGGTVVTVSRRSTGTSIGCSPNPVNLAQSTTCTATVTDSSPGVPSTPAGTVGFTSTGAGSFTGSPCSLVAGSIGTASCNVTYSPSGTAPRTDTITGVFTSAASDSVHNGSQGMFSLSVGVVVVDPTSTSVSCSPGTVVVNQATTCTATVTDTASTGATPPTGTVTFTPGGSCTLSNLSGASASCSVNITPSASGSLLVSASYVGDATHGTSSGSTSVTVNNRATSMSFSCSPSQVASNGATNCNATVTDTDAGTANTPTGTVSFTSNSTGTFTPGTSCSLVAGATTGVSSCQVTYTPSAAGHHLLNATYAGDTSHSGSSNSFNLPVGVSVQPTTTTVSCSPSSVVVNQGTSCTATVTDTSGTPTTSTGLVTFTTNSTGTLTPATSCTLAASATTGVATCSVTYTPSVTGHHGISGSYGGDATHAASTTNTAFTLTVAPRTTSTSVACTPSSVVVNQGTSCTATVTDTSAGTMITPTGTVTFASNSTGTFSPAASCALAAGSTAGTAACSVTYTPGVTGHHLITGTYAGDSTHSGSSNSFNLPVGVSVHSTTMSVSCSPSSVVVNQGTSCTATVTDTSATPTTPTGSVSFTTNSTGTFAPAGSCTLAASATIGVATCSVNYTPGTTGHHVITGTYAGDPGHTGSSGTATLTVTPQTPQPYALVISHEGKVFRYQNGTFTLIGQPVTTPLRQVAWKPDGSYALIVGDSGVLLKYDGTQLTMIPTGITANLYSLAWKPDGSYALISGSGGPLFRYDGVLTRLTNPFTNSIRSISWNPSGTQALLVGSSGGMLLYQSSNGQISQISSGTTAYLYSSAWNPNGLYALAAGEKGVIVRYDGSSVTILNTAGLYNSTAIIHAISWNPSGTTALLVGDLGVVLTYDGSQLTSVQSPNSSDLYAISWLGSTAYIAGGSGSSLTYTGGVLSTLANNTGTSLRGWAWKPN